MHSKENTHSFSYSFMAEGCLSSQVIFPFFLPLFLYRITIPVYHGMLSSTFTKLKVSKIVTRNHSKIAKYHPK